MIVNSSYLNLPKKFWAYVKIIGQSAGYTKRGQITVPTIEEICTALGSVNLDCSELYSTNTITCLGTQILSYLQYRANILNNTVCRLLMDVAEAEAMFQRLHASFPLENMPPLPMNKQKNEKKNYAFFTGMINLLIARSLNGERCDYDPRYLAYFTKNGYPVYSLSRRVDGAYPSIVNPKAIWEIKEYYYTTTFGSRVADGVYETLVDGAELMEVLENEKTPCHHYLFVDSKYTWWECGKSYLCRLIDMMHMGYVDEVIFGKEIETRIPEITKLWHS